MEFFCWADLDSACSDDYRIAVGTAYGIIDAGGTSQGAENFVDGAGGGVDCGLNDDFGDLHNTKDLVLFLDGVYAIDKTGADSGCVVVRLTCSEYSAANCPVGYVTRGPYTDEM
jgi:hypothetical protein